MKNLQEDLYCSTATKGFWNFHYLTRETLPEQHLCNTQVGDCDTLELQCLSTHYSGYLTRQPTKACEGAHASTTGILH
jgi:hypothetical protein